MIEKLRIYEAASFQPHFNLAVETYLMNTTAADECTLYLWQNQNTVVIGKNQNAWSECRTSLLEEEKGTLARRISGGGAVFHDLGNLNFTFAMTKDHYDLDKQLSVIQRACALAGITAEKSGRNDLLAQGRKFSGNAFYQNGTHAYHHGTLMVDVDKDKLGRYLSPPKAKLAAKGIASVRSRVVNLKELSPSLTIDRMKEYMKQAFREIYDCPISTITLDEAALNSIAALQAKYGSWEYLYGSSHPFTFDAQTRFEWGQFQLQMEAKSGIITTAKVYTDSLDWNIAQNVEQALTGCRFETAAMENAVLSHLGNTRVCQDICNFLKEQQL